MHIGYTYGHIYVWFLLNDRRKTLLGLYMGSDDNKCLVILHRSISLLAQNAVHMVYHHRTPQALRQRKGKKVQSTTMVYVHGNDCYASSPSVQACKQTI
jgi:hypothetical protein